MVRWREAARSKIDRWSSGGGKLEQYGGGWWEAARHKQIWKLRWWLVARGCLKQWRNFGRIGPQELREEVEKKKKKK